MKQFRKHICFKAIKIRLFQNDIQHEHPFQFLYMVVEFRDIMTRYSKAIAKGDGRAGGFKDRGIFHDC